MKVIEVFADISCPFTHAALRQFVAWRAEGGHELRLRVRAWPLEWVNGEPTAPELIAEEVGELRGAVAPDLFAGFDPARLPASTVPALRLAAAAYAAGVEVGEAVSLDLRDRLFERGQDVSAPAVLGEVAAAHGVSPPGAGGAPDRDDPVAADHAEGEQRGVSGSPHFFTPGGDFFSPSIEVSKVDGHVRVKPAPEGFARFTRACLA